MIQEQIDTARVVAASLHSWKGVDFRWFLLSYGEIARFVFVCETGLSVLILDNKYAVCLYFISKNRGYSPLKTYKIEYWDNKEIFADLVDVLSLYKESFLYTLKPCADILVSYGGLEGLIIKTSGVSIDDLLKILKQEYVLNIL